MKKARKWIAVLLILSMCASLVACSTGNKGNNDEDKTGEETKKPNSGNEPVDEGTVEITWWTSYGQSNMEYIKTMLEEFNTSQEKYHVTLINQGSPTAIRTQIASTKKKNLPDIISGTPVTTGYYACSKAIAPIQDFIDKDEEDWTSSAYEVVRTSYSDLDGNLIGWPLGVSSAGWFINTDLLEQAGYSVSDLTSLEQLAKAARAMVKSGHTKYGITFNNGGIDFYDMLTLQGVDIVDAGNGYSGTVTKSVLSEGETYKVLTKATDIIGGLYTDGVAYTQGSDINSSLIPMFVQETLAMFYATDSYANKIIQMNPNFKWAFIPSVGVDDKAKYKGYALSEGTGSYICNNGNDSRMQGAYEVIKFLAKPENQSFWSQCTGYVPYTEEASQQADYVEWMTANFPSLENVKAMLLASPADLRGPYCTVSNALLTSLNQILSSVCTEPGGDLKGYVEEAELMLNESIEIELLRNQ